MRASLKGDRRLFDGVWKRCTPDDKEVREQVLSDPMPQEVPEVSRENAMGADLEL